MPEVQPVGRYEWERVFRRCVLPGPVKGVARALAEFADADGSHIMAGVRTVSLSAGFSERATRSALDDLRRLGLIQRVGWGSNGGRRAVADEHRLTLPLDLLETVDMLPPDTRQWGQATTPVPTDGRRPTKETPASPAGDRPESVEKPGENSSRGDDTTPETPAADDRITGSSRRITGTSRHDHRHVVPPTNPVPSQTPDQLTNVTTRPP